MDLHRFGPAREKREKIYFSQVFTILHVKSFVQNIKTRLRWGRMINSDHLPATPGSFLMNFFFLGTSWLEISSKGCIKRGKCHFTAKIVHIIFKNARKNDLTLELLLELGQIKTGKWTEGERRRKHKCIV